MAIGDVETVPADESVHYVDTGMYDSAEYGSVYLIDDDCPALVDTGIGTNYERILHLLETVGVAPDELSVIALTHVHLDHAGGAGFLAEACPNAAVYVHEIGAPHLVDPGRLWEGTKGAVGEQIVFYTEPEPVPEERIEPITDGAEIDLGDHTLRAHHAPGHAPHQVVFEMPESDAVFTGDAAGVYTPSVDRIHATSPPPQFDLDGALEDVEMLQDLDPETLLYAHFGPAPADGRLSAYAERLQSWVAEVRDAHGDADDIEGIVERLWDPADAPEVWDERKARGEFAMNVRGVLASLDE
ncbi:Metal-dependent hydrolase of the beta-lactamase superfamily II [Halapricum desulfuricans]|uniref:Metal-dependent hydrolase of the beta-lactamase superfamily II n=1 Tax=Halapricum desulfuricans TaxID=2841257 RepID=A0A897NHQ2_9EURY|nr:MBL fold metallo-hydrolase [Halapricum desulfuricans]QSG11964.1 Metal-dependent hydrolase of the beta-lactamase superfamily II [Halapricum desulfuricans]